MRTIYLLCFLLVFAGTKVFAQADQERGQVQNQQQEEERKEEMKGSYFTVSGSIGSSSFDYKLKSLNETGTRKGGLGYGIDLRYSYFFSAHWGVTTGVGLSHYSTKGKLKGGITDNSYYNLGKQTDNDEEGRPRDFELRSRISNLEEKQNAYFLEIPLMISYKTYFGDSAKWGIYGGIGAKFQFPFSAKYKIQNGASSQFNVSGYYEGIPTDMGAPSNPPVPQHGYGTITDPNNSLNWDDKAKLKMGIAGTVELGFLFSLNKSTDLQIGGYMDYGFTDIKKNGKQGLFTTSSVYHPSANDHIGQGIQYNGMINSDVTGKIRPISFGAKIALKFKLGGKKEREQQKEQQY